MPAALTPLKELPVLVEAGFLAPSQEQPEKRSPFVFSGRVGAREPRFVGDYRRLSRARSGSLRSIRA